MMMKTCFLGRAELCSEGAKAVRMSQNAACARWIWIFQKVEEPVGIDFGWAPSAELISLDLWAELVPPGGRGLGWEKWEKWGKWGKWGKWEKC